MRMQWTAICLSDLDNRTALTTSHMAAILGPVRAGVAQW